MFRFKFLAFLCLLLLTFIGTSVIGAPIANAGQNIVNHQQSDMTMPTTNNTVNAPGFNNAFITITTGADSVHPENIMNYAAANDAVFRNEVSNYTYVAAGISFDSGFVPFMIVATSLVNNTVETSPMAELQVTTSLKLPVSSGDNNSGFGSFSTSIAHETVNNMAINHIGVNPATSPQVITSLKLPIVDTVANNPAS